MSDQRVTICRVCRNALDFHLSIDGVEWLHTYGDVLDGVADHEPEPERAPEGWRGKCDFCNATPDFKVPARTFEMIAGHHSDGDWAACGPCAFLIERDRWGELLRRAAAGHEKRHGRTMGEAEQAMLKRLYRMLRKNITGSVRPL